MQQNFNFGASVWILIHIPLFLIKSATIMDALKAACSKNSDQLPIVKRLTDSFAVDKFDYGIMLRYQNLTQNLNSSRPLEPGPP